MLQKIRKFINDNALLPKSDALHLVALSGGADSVCLLLILKELGYNIEAVHCNFHLRGEESDRDEAFCRELCSRENIPFHIAHFDTTTYAETHKISIEMAARELRYSYFETLRKDICAADICVAHHKDDSVETLLLNLVRGTGIHGLQGIKPRNGNIVRPLLCLDRNEIETWLKKRGQSYVTDSTNLHDDVMRNKLRLNIIPLLKDVNPAVCENIHKTAFRMVEAGKVFDTAMQSAIREHVKGSDDSLSILTKDILAQPSTEYFLFSILSEKGFTPSQIESISHSDFNKTGATWHSPTHTLLVDRDSLLVRRKETKAFKPFRIPEHGKYIIYEDNKKSVSLDVRENDVNGDFVISRDKMYICLDAKNIVFPLTVRRYNEGERFVPFGMKGSKLISDYLTDRKRNAFEKAEQLVVVDAKERVLWLVGERTDNRFRVTSDTIKSLTLRYNCIQ